MPDRISRKRAESEGWLSVREVRDATGLGHATLQERLHNAARDGIRVARLESGEWRVHKDDVARIPRKYEARGAPRSQVEALAQEVAGLKAALARLEAGLVKAAPAAGP